jgi:hypothetical protein
MMAATDPTSGTKVAEFLQPLSAALEPVIALDSALNRAYFFDQEQLSPSPLWTFATFNLQTQTVVEKARVSGCSLQPGGVNGKFGRLVRWGSNGLAVNCDEEIEIISGVFVTS